MSMALELLTRVARLFVDDSIFALAIIVWLSASSWLLPRLAGGTAWGGLALFAGLAAILLVGAHRAARTKRMSRRLGA